MTYRELAERAVLVLHMYSHASFRSPNFPECREGLCDDWHALESRPPERPTFPPPTEIKLDKAAGSLIRRKLTGFFPMG